MASYCPITLPAVAAWRSYALSALARGGATVYQHSGKMRSTRRP